MAVLSTYRCIFCGYEVMTDPTGHYATMAGHSYNCRCDVCNTIVSISGDELAPECPECGADMSHLFTWNPVDGCCPKCGGGMHLDESAERLCVD